MDQLELSENGSINKLTPITPTTIAILVITPLLGLLFAWFAQVRVDGGFALVFAEDYNRSPEATVLFVKVLYQVLFATLLISIALIFPKFAIIQRINLWLSLFFGWMFIGIIYNSTHNFILLILALILSPSMYWYYIKFGEVKSYFANRYIVFILRRLLAIVPLFISLSLFTFFLSHAIGDPVKLLIGMQRFPSITAEEAMKAKFGLNLPLHEQYLNWVWGFIHGDFGLSFKTQASVNIGFNAFVFETLKLQILALTVAFTLSIIIGVAAAYYHNTMIDSAVSAIALLGLSMPIFVVGIILILTFGGRGLGWFPSNGAHAISVYLPPRKPGEWITDDLATNWTSIVWWGKFIQNWLIFTFDSLEHLVLPLITLAFATMATFARLTRASMLEILRQDYILAARANGLSERDVIWKHGFRNVLLPLVTFLGLSVGGLLAGAPITETVFTWPGLGIYFVRSLRNLDFPVMLTITMLISTMILISNLITDIVYTFVDPRVTI